MVVNRVSNAEKQAKTLNEIESKFIAGIERNNLKTLSLEELVQRFEDIEQQGQLIQGQILLEARSRFAGDKEFGQWRASSLWACSASQCSRLIQLARFFSDSKPLDKISITAAYEISAPINADVADEVYNEVRGRNIPVAEIKRKISIKKGIPNTSIQSTSAEQRVEIIEENKHTVPLPIKPIEPATDITSVTPKSDTGTSEKSKVEIILQDVLAGLTSGEKIKILGECLRIEREYPKK